MLLTKQHHKSIKMKRKLLILFVALLTSFVSAQRATISNLGNTANKTFGTTRDCAISKLTVPDCSVSKYQSLDGTCNNLINPYSGASNTPFKRYLPPDYADLQMTFRRSSAGGELPAARRLSNALNDNDVIQSPSMSAMHVQFGQFITHDFAHAAPMNQENGVNVNCQCENSSKTCINIPIAAGDNYYGPEATCIQLPGSKTVEGCDNLPREQINAISAFIDGTTIYGTGKEMLDALRDNNSDSGELLVIGGNSSGFPFHKNIDSLPTRKDIASKISSKTSCPASLNPPGSTCFVSGDVRTNENVGLSSTHLLFVREHNRIGRRLKSLNPQWDSDIVFNEARRIINAIHQIITYREFLPPLLGSELMKQAQLEVLDNGFYFGYDASVDATIYNEFTTAALRYGHSQVMDRFNRPGPDYVTVEHPSLRMFQTLFQQEAVVNKTSASILRGLTSDPALAVDHRFVDDIRNRMFESSESPGNDLFAINIQRGREHGLPSYNKFREFCGLPKAVEWMEYSDYINKTTIRKFQAVYKHVDDVDLYVGGLAESPVEGGALGPTFACLFAYQFRDLRKGDRFWFENPGQFSAEQLRELRKVKMSRLFCDNMEGMKTVSPYVMLRPEGFNERVPCSSLPEMDLSTWKQFDGRQDGEWSRWIITSSFTKDNALLRQRDNDAMSVCYDPIKVEIASLPVSKNGKKKVRFFCPIGSNPSTNFPITKQSLDHEWTSWLDRDSPSSSGGDDVETLSYHRLERPDEVCKQPMYIQAQTKDLESAFNSDEVFKTLSASSGLTCRGKHQVGGKCKDYRVRFYCPKAHKAEVEKNIITKLGLAQNRGISYVWTSWINLSSPNRGNFEDERLETARKRNFSVCNKPLRIDARVVGSKVTAQKTSDVLKRFSTFHGLLCDNKDQTRGKCHDYEVRYLCPRSTAGQS